MRSASRIVRALGSGTQVDAVTAACEAAGADDCRTQSAAGLVTYRLNMGSPRWSEAVKRDFTLIHRSCGTAFDGDHHSGRPDSRAVALTEHQYCGVNSAWTRPGYGSHCRAGGVANWRNPDRPRPGGLIIWVTSPGPWGLIVICAISSYILFAAMPVNYAFAVIFVTSLIVTMLDLSGDDLISSFRTGIGTILGGVIALIASQIGAQWAGPTLPTKLVSSHWNKALRGR